MSESTHFFSIGHDFGVLVDMKVDKENWGQIWLLTNGSTYCSRTSATALDPAASSKIQVYFGPPI